jgi:hypothetical protein
MKMDCARSERKEFDLNRYIRIRRGGEEIQSSVHQKTNCEENTNVER